ncbi:MAG TPA: hypothetical protein VGG68_01030 [Caulobacteraceae bacterium]|jgi:hypothetical protein
MRIVIAGILGGIAMFVWANIAHIATPLATIGLTPLPNDAVVVQLRQQLGDKTALYFFPYAAGTDSKSMAVQEARLRTEPSGLLAYQGPGQGSFPRQMIVEFTLEVVEAILVGVVLMGTAGFVPRMGLALAVGLVAAISTNFSYWNWYGFSTGYTLATGFTELVKYLVAGAVVAWWLGRNDRMARALSDARLSGH